MNRTGAAETGGNQADRRVTFSLAAVLVVGFAVRAQISLVPDFLTGADGAYYLVQVRAILRHGRLAIPDFPFIFYLQAGLAWILSLGMDPEASIVAAVRWIDAVMPVLLAVPVCLFVRRFSQSHSHRHGPILAMILGGLLATTSFSPLWMAGGAIKNGCVLPFSLLAIYYLFLILERSGRYSVMLTLAAVLISSLTHVSALALNATLMVLVVVISMVMPTMRPLIWRPALGLSALLLVIVSTVLVLDPARGWRFLGVLAHPERFFAGSPVIAWLQGMETLRFESVFSLPVFWSGNALGLLGLYTLWRYCSRVNGATCLILWTTTLTTILFSCPLLAPDLLERLSAVAFLPGLVPLIFLLCREISATVIVAPLTVLAMLGGALTVKTARMTSLVRPAYEELVRLKTVLPPGKNLIIVRHELNWWVVWTMDVHFSTRVRYAMDERTRYDSVLLLDEISDGAFGHRAPLRRSLNPGSGIKDGELLRPDKIRLLVKGVYFQLSRVEEDG